MKQNLSEYPTEFLFYKDGLKFECQKCSNCCRKTPGYVFLSKKDLKCVSNALNKTEQNIIKQYCRIIDFNGFKRLSLIEKLNFDCIFWEEKHCLIYRKRPIQCKCFPFWRHNMESIQTWTNLKKECPGIDKGKNHSKQTIEYWINFRQKEGLLTEKDIEKYFC